MVLRIERDPMGQLQSARGARIARASYTWDSEALQLEQLYQEVAD